MNDTVAIIIPYYHDKLTQCERISLDRCLSVFQNRKIIALVPETISPKIITDKRLTRITVPDKWMDGVEGYNKMMLTHDFYRLFEEYEYILIHQLDAFVFYDKLMHFCYMGYDYIGAPWLYGVKNIDRAKNGVMYVGNGGLSLRKVDTFIRKTKSGIFNTFDMPEDVLWSSEDGYDFSVAPVDIAVSFSIDQYVRACFDLNNRCLPFGCHAWDRHDFEFWREYFEKIGYSTNGIRDKAHDKCNTQNIERLYYLEADSEEIKDHCMDFFLLAGKGIIIWGAGKNGDELAWVFSKANINIDFFVDSYKKDELLRGIEIHSISYLDNYRSSDYVVIVSTEKDKEYIFHTLMDKGYMENRNIFSYVDWKKSFNQFYKQKRCSN